MFQTDARILKQLQKFTPDPRYVRTNISQAPRALTNGSTVGELLDLNFYTSRLSYLPKGALDGLIVDYKDLEDKKKNINNEQQSFRAVYDARVSSLKPTIQTLQAEVDALPSAGFTNTNIETIELEIQKLHDTPIELTPSEEKAKLESEKHENNLMQNFADKIRIHNEELPEERNDLMFCFSKHDVELQADTTIMDLRDPKRKTQGVKVELDNKPFQFLWILPIITGIIIGAAYLSIVFGQTGFYNLPYVALASMIGILIAIFYEFSTQALLNREFEKHSDYLELQATKAPAAKLEAAKREYQNAAIFKIVGILILIILELVVSTESIKFINVDSVASLDKDGNTVMTAVGGLSVQKLGLVLINTLLLFGNTILTWFGQNRKTQKLIQSQHEQIAWKQELLSSPEYEQLCKLYSQLLSKERKSNDMMNQFQAKLVAIRSGMPDLEARKAKTLASLETKLEQFKVQLQNSNSSIDAIRQRKQQELNDCQSELEQLHQNLDNYQLQRLEWLEAQIINFEYYWTFQTQFASSTP